MMKRATIVCTLILTAASAAARPHTPRYLDCAVDGGNGKAYLFRGADYIRFDIGADRADPGYPQPIARGFTGVWDRDLDAAFNAGNGKLFFFKGAEYIRFDVVADRADPGYPKPIAGKWPGLWDRDLDAAYNGGKGKAYFFKGAEYVRYDIAADRADPGYPKPIAGNWPGLWNRDLDAVFNAWNNRAYFFKGTDYVRYDVLGDRAAPGFPRPIAGNWNGLWPIAGAAADDCPEALVTRAGLQCKPPTMSPAPPVPMTPIKLPPPPPPPSPAVDVPEWDTGPDALPRAKRTARGAALSCVQRQKRPAPPAVPYVDDAVFPATDTAGPAAALAALTEAQRRTVTLIEDNRRKLEPLATARLSLVTDPNTVPQATTDPPARQGWSHLGKRQAQWPETLARTEAAARTPREKQQIAVWEELFREGNVTSIATWDATFSFGAGYASMWTSANKTTSGDLFPVMQKFFADPAIGPLFRNFGLGIDAKGFHVVNTRTGQVETGPDALEMLICDRVLDAAFIAIGEGDPIVGRPHRDPRQLLVNIQWSLTGGSNRAGDVRDYAYAWPRARVQFLAHVIHLWFYANWSSPAYAGSAGVSDREFLVRVARALEAAPRAGIRDMGAATSDDSVRYRLITFGGRANDRAYFHVFGGGGYLRSVVGGELPMFRIDGTLLPVADGMFLPAIAGVRRGGDPVYLVRDPSPCEPTTARCKGYSAYYLVSPGSWTVPHVVASLAQTPPPMLTWLLMKYSAVQRAAIWAAWPADRTLHDQAFFAGAQVQLGERLVTPVEREALKLGAAAKYGNTGEIMRHIDEILTPPVVKRGGDTEE